MQAATQQSPWEWLRNVNEGSSFNEAVKLGTYLSGHLV